MGNANSRSMAFLQSAVARGEIDLVLHLVSRHGARAHLRMHVPVLLRTDRRRACA